MTMQYDDLDRLIRKDFHDGTFEAWTYTDNGLVATSTDSRGVTMNTYDSRDRLISVTQPDGGYINYTYDAHGNRLSVTQPDGGYINYTYDALNRLETVTDAQGKVTTYQYDAVGNRSGMSYASGNTTAYTYDALNRLTQITHADAQGATQGLYQYTLGPAGNRLSIADHTGRVVNYTYDTTYKLLTETVTDVLNVTSFDVSYTYDRVGNRLTKTIDGTLVTTTRFDDNDRIQSEITDTGTTAYTFDDNGNTISKDSAGVLTTYRYDPENQLKSITEGGSVTMYTYDDQGMRVGKNVNGIETTYLLDKNRAYAQVVSEYPTEEASNYVATGATTVSYTYGDDLVSQRRDDGTGTNTTSTYLYDGLGSTRLLIDEAGAVTDTYLYEAFGEILEQTGTTENDYLYTGEQYDANAGFYYLRARYYNPGQGRFSSADRFDGYNSDPVSLHKYLYANVDPVLNIDPSGFETMASLSMSQAVSNIVSSIRLPSLAPLYSKTIRSLIFHLGTGAMAVAIGSNLLHQQEKERAREKLEALVAAAAMTSRQLLYHYTNQASARGIFSCQCMFTTRGYRHTDGDYRPKGAYATPLQPWLKGLTQAAIRGILWDKDRGQATTHFVAIINDGTWKPVGSGVEYVKKSLGDVVHVKAVYFGATLLEVGK